jgi:DNA-binding transcriptional MerR regulator
MKMKDLVQKLEEEDVVVTERMIRHYIDIGLLPEPERPFKNQAIYNIEHYKRLYVIDSFKKNGLSLEDIKKKMSELNVYFDKLKQYGDPSSGVNEEINEFSLDLSMLEAKYTTLTNKVEFFDIKQVAKETGYPEDYVRWAIKEGIVKEKEIYDSVDVYAIEAYLFYNYVRHIDDEDYAFSDTEISEIMQVAKTIVRLADRNPYFYMFLAAMIARYAKDAILEGEKYGAGFTRDWAARYTRDAILEDGEIDVVWEGICFDQEYKEKYIEAKEEKGY